jgi:glycerol-3-phosphate acyltransferase PlsY
MGMSDYGSMAVVAYLLSSIPSGVIAARAFRQVDVCVVGSGHTGAINTFRAAGLAPAALTLLADGAKGVLAISVARQWVGAGYAVAFAATFVVVGHCYPLFTRFRGGMGLTTAGGVFLVLQPLVLVALIIVWFPLKWLMRESLYASLAVALLLPGLLILRHAEPSTLAAGVGVGAILLFRHLPVAFERRRAIRLAE